MSRSYRKPYSSVVGRCEAHKDKTFAARSVRRTQNRYLRNFNSDWDEFLIPERYECSDNDVWGWKRDGKQKLRFPPDWNRYYCYQGLPWWTPDRILDCYLRVVKEYKRLKRK